MHPDKLAEYQLFAHSLAERARKIMLEYHRADTLETQWKQDNSPVTIADLTINKLVIESVKSTYPKHGIIGEEESFEPDRNDVWIVDPVDGTAPFDLGMQASTFCLAFVSSGQVQVAVVLDPFGDRLFTAARGRGTKLNGKNLKITSGSDFSHTYAFVPAGSEANSEEYLPVQRKMREAGAKITVLPSIAYMASFILENKMLVAFMSYGSPWDAAAIALLVEEAGGRATDLKGVARRWNEWGDGLLLTNGVVHEQMVKWLSECAS